MHPATIRQCVVLVDGPAMRTIGDRPFLAWVLREFIRFGVDDFLLLGGDPDVETIATTLPKRVSVSACTGVLHDVRDRLAERFLLFDGNSLFDLNISQLLAEGAGNPAIAWTVLGDNKRNAGIHLRNRSNVGHDDSARREITVDGGLIATPARLHRRALFLDRDGVINVDHGYVGTRDRFEWMPGAIETIRAATGAGLHVFVVTNQSGVARGLYTEAQLTDLNDWMTDEVRAAGGTIDDLRYCPFHPQAKLDAYRRISDWRKPAPGMLLDLIAKWELDPASSLLIGDQPSDLAAAGAAGVPGHLFRGGNLAGLALPLLRLPRPGCL
jgi:D,D-heptose 1,7-bisphosphate phosphatase